MNSNVALAVGFDGCFTKDAHALHVAAVFRENSRLPSEFRTAGRPSHPHKHSTPSAHIRKNLRYAHHFATPKQMTS